LGGSAVAVAVVDQCALDLEGRGELALGQRGVVIEDREALDLQFPEALQRQRGDGNVY
jgi:hypothetical protein